MKTKQVRNMKARIPVETPISADQNVGSAENFAAKLAAVEILKGYPQVRSQKMIEAVKPGMTEIDAGEQFIAGLELIMLKWVEAGAAKADSKSRKATGFHSLRAPSMSLKLYLQRIKNFFDCSDECFILALVFISRVTKKVPSMTICDVSVHRMTFFAMMMAAKIHDDLSYSNGYYAKVGGLPLKEVNILELEFLKMLDYKTFVQPNEYEMYHSFVCQAAKRGESKPAPHAEPEPEP